MQTNPPILLLDTNIWLDIFLPRRTHYQATLQLIDAARNRNYSLVYAAHTALDVYQKVMHDNKDWIRKSRELTEVDAITIKRFAWDCVNQMREWATAIGVDGSDMALACHFRDRLDDLEDDFVLAAAQRAGANYLVTADKEMLARSPIEAHTSADMLELIRTGRAKGTPISRDVPGDNDWFYRWLAQYE